MNALKFLHSDAFDSAETHIRHKPFSFMTSAGLLDDAARAQLAADFPRYPGAGFFPHEAADCGPSINLLIEELTSHRGQWPTSSRATEIVSTLATRPNHPPKEQ